MIDVKTTDPTEPGQKRPMRVLVAGILAAAAAVVAIVFVASRDVDVVTPADEPSTTVTVPPAPPPIALASANPFDASVADFIALAPGTYFVDEVDGTPTARIVFTIGAGWSYASGESVWQNNGYIFFSRRPGAVFLDACHPSDGYHPGPVATVDGLVAALSEQGGWADVTTPSDISVDGYAGKAFQRTAPAEISDCSTAVVGHSPRIRPGGIPGSWPSFPSWENEDGSLELNVAGEIETLWVLDIDGTVVVINTSLLRMTTEATAVPSAAARADFAAVLDSIRIERG